MAVAPPEGPPWDLRIAEAPLVFVDLEMSGLDPKKDRVLELCLERVVGEKVERRLASLVRPDDAAFGNRHIHGIDPADIAKAPTFADLADDVLALLDGAVLVAHAAVWDVSFLEAELARAGRPRAIRSYLDTLTLSRRAFALPSHRLGALADALGIARVNAHRAEDDVRVLREVFRKILSVLEPTTPRDLWHVRIAERHARPDVVAAAVRACEGELPVLVRYRPARRAPEDVPMRITAVRTDVDPPRVLGYDTVTRSRKDLRADRILAIEPIEEARDR
ncbi:MAG TPA: 3'-5' exonuclease [Minicystis sp.]|nr:3'-5' exonuclease [Minicystis sp.]